MVEQLRAMLAKADTMEEALAMLEAAYPKLDAGPLAQALTQAGLVAQLAGRADVLQEVDDASR
jgi:phage gp29-like protein